jgi:hypothetical protein
MKTFFSSFLYIPALIISPASFAEPVGITPEISSEALGRTTVK